MPTVIEHLSKPIDRASLTVFRVAFGLLMFVGVVRFFAYGWIDAFYTTPRYFFTYPGFDWVKPWPAPFMHVHYALMGLAALGIAFGRYFRASAISFTLLFAYAELIDKTNYLNHYYYVTLVAALMALMPLGGKRQSVPAWCLYLLRFQAAIVYIFAGIAKLNYDWLIQAQPLRIWLGARSEYWGVLDQAWVAYVASWAGAIFDCFVVPALLWRRTRPFAFAAVIVFHVCTWMLFDIGLFPWLMIASAMLFFAPDWPRRQRIVLAPEGRRVPAFAVAAMVLYCAVQVALPLRRHFYEGETLWTEEGFRFAWNVMLIEKAGVASYEVKEPSTGKSWHVEPTDTLTPWQAKMFATQPDMLVQFAEHLRDDACRRGVRDPEVFIRSAVSFNGRARRPMFPADESLVGRASPCP